MKVRALTNFSLGGGRDVAAGDEFELSAGEAQAKLYRGWVELVVDGEPEHPEASADVLADQDAEASNREPRRSRGRS